MDRKLKSIKQIIALVLCLSIFSSQLVMAEADAADTADAIKNIETTAFDLEAGGSSEEFGGLDADADDGFFADEEDTGKADSSDSSTSDQGDGANKSDKAEDTDTSDKTELEDEKKATESELEKKYDAFYRDGQICIYNYKQLQMIGSGEALTTGDKDGRIGKGDPVEIDDEVITYAEDAAYRLMNDIPLDTEEIWTVPENFAGSIGQTMSEGDEDCTIYDKDTDTIYIYNPYQLMILAQEDREEEPVMTLDYDAAQFGMGQMIYPDGEDEAYITYSKEHHYVLSKNFSSDTPELTADQLSVATNDAEGRDFKGQVIKTIGDKTYILIGNREQLAKIGTEQQVNGAVYQAYLHLGKWYVDTDQSGKPIMLYGGDADLKKKENGTEDYEFGRIKVADKTLSSQPGLYTRGRCGVNQKTGNIDPDLDIEKAAENQKYTANANYIIFRDIDLGGENWKPLTFQGTMIGAKLPENTVTVEGTESAETVEDNETVEDGENIENVGTTAETLDSGGW